MNKGNKSYLRNIYRGRILSVVIAIVVGLVGAIGLLIFVPDSWIIAEPLIGIALPFYIFVVIWLGLLRYTYLNEYARVLIHRNFFYHEVPVDNIVSVSVGPVWFPYEVLYGSMLSISIVYRTTGLGRVAQYKRIFAQFLGESTPFGVTDSGKRVLGMRETLFRNHDEMRDFLKDLVRLNPAIKLDIDDPKGLLGHL